MKRFSWAIAAVVAVGVLPASAGTGTVVDEKAQPLADVSACYVLNGIEVMCVSTDERGVFDLPPSEVGKIRLTLPGYLPQLFDKIPEDPIVLAKAAEIWVRLIDADGVALDSGEVFLLFPTGERKGPFPSNAFGVRVRTLTPGTYRVVARATGYIQPRSHSVELVGGMVADARVEMVPDPGPEAD